MPDLPDATDDDAFDAVDEFEAEQQDWSRLDELAERKAAVTGKADAIALYDELAGR